MRNILLAIGIISCSICYGDNPLDVFNNGLDGIPWNSSRSQIQEDLTKRGISFETQKKENNKCDISFNNNGSSYTLHIQHDRFYSLSKQVEFYDPQNRSMDFWSEFIHKHYGNPLYETDSISSAFMALIFPNTEIGGKPQSAITLSFLITSKIALESRNQESMSLLQPAFEKLFSNTIQEK